MARPINAALSVFNGFVPTANPGEYTFDSAIFNNQADATNNGAGDVQIGFVLFVPATDPNIGAPIPGIYHRYKLTAVTVVDAATLSGTMLWDEPGPELDVPTGISVCMLCEVTPNLGIAILPSEAIYSELSGGASMQAHQVDVRNRMDNLGGGGGGDAGIYTKNVLTPSATTGIDQQTLTHTPLDAERVSIWINGFRYWPEIDFTITGGTTINWSNTEFIPNQFDTVIAEYTY